MCMAEHELLVWTKAIDATLLWLVWPWSRSMARILVLRSASCCGTSHDPHPGLSQFLAGKAIFVMPHFESIFPPS